jgi:hypothetical protein
MKKLTRDRVVPIISASISWLIFGVTLSGAPSLLKRAIGKRIRPSRSVQNGSGRDRVPGSLRESNHVCGRPQTKNRLFISHFALSD